MFGAVLLAALLFGAVLLARGQGFSFARIALGMLGAIVGAAVGAIPGALLAVGPLITVSVEGGADLVTPLVVLAAGGAAGGLAGLWAADRLVAPQRPPWWAWAAFFNFVAFLVFPLKVEETIRNIIHHDIVDTEVIAATLIAACLWNLFTWYAALPTSSSHALIGGMVGSALAKTALSLDALQWGKVGKTVAFIFLSPLIGLVAGLVFAVAVTWLFRRSTPRHVDQVFRSGQFLSAAWFSLNHGGNDAQKTMGIIMLLVVLGQGQGGLVSQMPVPMEVVLACHVAMGLGTLMGGWRIVRTMGQRIIRLRPVDGFCAETGAGVALALATSIGGIPVSTTHTITGSIVGVGALKRFSAVRWGVAGRVVWAWILTIPGTALFAAVAWWLLSWAHHLLGGTTPG
jgi:PiT family inorganic phosphate transporter